MKKLLRILAVFTLGIVLIGFNTGCDEVEGFIDDMGISSESSDESARDTGGTTSQDSQQSTEEDTGSTPGTTADQTVSDRPWEAIDCSMSDLPAPPGPTGSAPGWRFMDIPARNVIDESLIIVQGTGSGLYALGCGGTLLRLDAAPLRWTQIETGSNKCLNDMASVSGWYSIIVGEDGTVLTYSQPDGIVRELDEPFPGDADLIKVWGDNSEDFYVLGEDVFYHYAPLPPSHAQYDPQDPSPKWQYCNTPVPPALGDPHAAAIQSVWVNDYDSVFVLIDHPTEGYYTLEWDGNEWGDKKPIPTNNLIRNIWGLAHNDIFAVGVAGLVMHFDGAEWNEFNNLGLDMWNSYSNIWGTSHSNMYTVGDYSTTGDSLYHYDGQSWSGIYTPATNGLWSVFGNTASVGGVYLTTSEGDILHYEDVLTDTTGELTWHGSYTQTWINDVASDGTNNYFVGSEGNSAKIVINNQRTLLFEDVGLQAATVKNDFLYAAGSTYNGQKTGIGLIKVDLSDYSHEYFENYEDYQEGLYILIESITVDTSGSVYVGGQTSGPIADQVHAGMYSEDSLTGYKPNNPVAMDAFIIKYSPQFERQWARVFGNPDSDKYPFGNRNGDRIFDMTIDSQGRLIAAGQTAEPGVFQPPAHRDDTVSFPVENLCRNPNAAYPNEMTDGYGFVTIFDTDGTLLKGQGWDIEGRFVDMECTDTGDIYLSGISDCAGYIDTQLGNGLPNILVMKLDADLNQRWIRYIPNIGQQIIEDSSVTQSGGLYITGGSTESFGGRTYSDGRDVFVTELSADGVLQGTLMFGGTNWDYGALISTRSNGDPVIWIYTESPSIEGYDTDNPQAGAFWMPGAIPYDPYAECRLRIYG